MPEFFDNNELVGLLQDGRKIASGEYSQVVSAGNVNVVVRVPDLKEVQTVLNVEFYTDPDAEIESGYQDKKITGNVVGFTVYSVGSGTTLTSKVVAVGPP